MNKCIKDLTNDANSSELRSELLDLVILYDGDDLKQATINKVQQLLTSESAEYREDLYDIFLEILDSVISPFTDLSLSKDSLLRIKLGSFDITDLITKDKTTKDLENASKDEPIETYNKLWLTSAYRYATGAAQRAESFSLLGVISAGIVNRGDLGTALGTITKSALNTSIINYQERLYQDLLGYLKYVCPPEKVAYLEANFPTLYEVIDAKHGTRNVRKANGQDALSYIEANFKLDFPTVAQLRQYSTFASQEFSTKSLMQRYQDGDLLDTTAYLDGYQAYVFLTNFDSMLRGHLGRNILIKEGLFNQLSALPDKYTIAEKTTDSYIYNNEDEIFPEEVVSKIVQKLIETTHLWVNGRKTSQYLTFAQFNAVVANIKELVYNDATSQITALEILQTYLVNSMTKDYINYLRQLYNKRTTSDLTLREIINSIVDNPMEGFAAVIDIVHSNALWKNLSIKLDYRVSDKAIRNYIDSIYHGVTGVHGEKAAYKSLFELMPTGSLTEENYYSYVTLAAASIFKNNFTQCYYDSKTDSFRLRTLADQSVARLLLRIEQAIATRNSSLLFNLNLKLFAALFIVKKEGENESTLIDAKELHTYVTLGYKPTEAILYIPLDYGYDNDIKFYTGTIFKATVPLVDKSAENPSKIEIELENTSHALKKEHDDLYQSLLKGIVPNDIDSLDFTSITDVLNSRLDSESAEKYMNHLLGIENPGFLEHILDLQMFNNPAYKLAFFERFPDFQGNEDKAEALRSIMKMAAHVAAQSLVINLDNTNMLSMSDIQNTLSERFDPKFEPEYSHATGSIAPINDKLGQAADIRITLAQLAYAKAAAQGASLASQVKDTEGNGLSNYTLSRLLGSVQSQMDIQCRALDSATSNLSLIRNPSLLKAFTKLQEVTINGEAKKTIDMNLSELTYASFIINFMLGYVDVTSKNAMVGRKSATELLHGFLASVNSDKPVIDYLIANLNSRVFKKNSAPKGLEQLEDKNYSALTIEDIKYLISYEIGGTYRKVLSHIQEDYNRLLQFVVNEAWMFDTNAENFINEWLKKTNGLIKKANGESVEYINNDTVGTISDYINQNNIVLFNYADNFSAFKEIIGKDNAKRSIETWCLLHNRLHPITTIELVDQLHMNKGLMSNRTLIDLVNRFQDPETNPLEVLTSQADFWRHKEAELITQLLDGDFSYSIGTSQVDALFTNPNDYNAETGCLNLGKFTYNYRDSTTSEVKTIIWNLSNKNDLLDLQHQIEQTGYIDTQGIDHQPGEKINLVETGKLISIGSLQLNSYLAKYNLFDYLFTQEHLLTSVGSHIAHPDKSNSELALAQEASRFFAQHKRNVSETASMHEFLKNLLNGIPNTYNIACIDDINDILFNLVGLSAKVKPFDGATFVHPLIVRLENYSLGAEKAGNSKKQFVHFYNQRTANGGIVKTCGFGITNQLAMNSTMANCLRKMMSNLWFDDRGLFGDQKGIIGGHLMRIDLDLWGKSITSGDGAHLYKDLFYFNPLTNRYYKRRFLTDSDPAEGQLYMSFDFETGLYSFIDEECATTFNPATNTYESDGALTGLYVTALTTNSGTIYQIDGVWRDANNVEVDYPTFLATAQAINNNWSAYLEWFKGQYCYDIVPNLDGTEDGLLHYSEVSLDNLTVMANNMGYIKENVNPSNVITLRHVWQPAKHADIHYLVTAGAIKQGAANMNPASSYTDNTPLNFLQINTNQIGIQLDKEHHADNEELSMLLQVIQGCANRGYTSMIAILLYLSLANRVEAGIQEQFSTFEQFLKSPESKEEFATAIKKIMLKAIMNASPKDGNLINNIAAELLEQIKQNPNLQPVDIATNLPFSDQALFKLLNTMVAAFINRHGIRTKLDGVLSVLNPSVGIKKLHNGHNIDFYLPENSLRVSELLNLFLLLNIEENSSREQGIKALFNGVLIPKALLADLYQAPNIILDPESGEFDTTFKNFKTKVFINGTYLVERINEFGKSVWEKVNVKKIEDIKQLETDIKEQRITTIIENYIDGRDLAHYNCVYKAKDSNTYYNMYDLDSCEMLFKLKSLTGDKLLSQIQSREIRVSDTIDLKNLQSTEDLYQFWTRFIKNFGHLLPNLKSSFLKRLFLYSEEYGLTAQTPTGPVIVDNEEAFSAVIEGNKSFIFELALELKNIEALLRRLLQSDLAALTPELKENAKNLNRLSRLQELKQQYANNEISYDLVCAELETLLPSKFKPGTLLSYADLLAEEKKLENITGQVNEETDNLLRMKKYHADAKQAENYAETEKYKGWILELLDAITRHRKEQIDSQTKIRKGSFDLDFEIGECISKTNSLFLINGQLLQVDKTSVQIKPYEVIMPKKFKSTYGLSTFTDLLTIKNDPDYFVNKLRKTVSKSDTNLHLVAFKRLSGEHTYLLPKDLFESSAELKTALTKKKILKDPTRDQSTVWRVNSENLHIQKLHTKIVNGEFLDDEIYTTIDGVEIIVTDNLDWYRDNLDYAVIDANFDNPSLNNEAAESVLSKFIENSAKSTNPRAVAWFRFTGLKENPTELIERQIRTIGREQWVSFMKTLEIVAARIPAQSLQSFMPMIVAAFDNVDVNSAYVSDAQIWLQGSDYDVDAVSLAMNSVNKNGIYEHWSSLANLSSVELLNASMHLPFPTGKNVVLKNINIKQNVAEYIQAHAPKNSEGRRKYEETYEASLLNLELQKVQNTVDALLNIMDNKIQGLELRKDKNGNAYLVYNNTTVDNIESIASFITSLNTIGVYNVLLQDFINTPNLHALLAKCIEKGYDLNKVFLALISFLNKYNTYINKCSEELQSLMSNNGVLHGMWATSMAPVNRLESETSVDATTGPFKDKANESSVSKELSTYTPGNVANKFKAIIANQVGKVGISICAVGTKVMAAWTTYSNRLLNEGTAGDQKRLLINQANARLNQLFKAENPFNPAVSDRSLNILANLHAIDEDTVYEETVLLSLHELDLDKDAVISLSALLSLATDNAKELCLSPLNANTNTLGMYIYGLSVGISFDEVARLMMSPLGLTVTQLMQGNAFAGKRGLTSVGSVLNYLVKGPSLVIRQLKQKDSKNAFLEAVKTVFKRSEHKLLVDDVLSLLQFKDAAAITQYNLFDVFGRIANLQADNGEFDIWAKIEFVRNIKKIALQWVENNPKAKQEIIKVCLDLISYMHLVSTILYEQYTDASGNFLAFKKDSKNRYIPTDLFKLETLSQGAGEMKLAGSILAINNGVKTKFAESMAFMRKLSNITLNRQQEVTDVHERHWYLLGDRANQQKPKPAVLKQKINLTEFMTNAAYRQSKINDYETVKHSLNVLDLIDLVPHFNAYLKAAVIEYTGKKVLSTKVRAAETIGEIGINLLGATNSKDIQKIYNATNDLVNDFIKRSWLKERLSDWTIPILTGLKYFSADGELITHKENETKYIPIYTLEGEATLKYWFENYVIPNLMAGREMNGSEAALTSTIKRNDFIRGLLPVVTDRTPIHVNTNAYSLYINMSPIDPTARNILSLYRNSFDLLRGETLNGKTILEWFWLYNNIVFQGKAGENTLTSIFDNFLISDELAKDFYNYEAEFDRSRDIIYGVDINSDDVIRWVTPVTGMYRSFLNYIYTDDPAILDKAIFLKNSNLEIITKEDYENLSEDENEMDAFYEQQERPYVPDPNFQPMEPARYFIRGNYQWVTEKSLENTLVLRQFGDGNLEVNFNVKNGKVSSVQTRVKTSEKPLTYLLANLKRNPLLANNSELYDRINAKCKDISFSKATLEESNAGEERTLGDALRAVKKAIRDTYIEVLKDLVEMAEAEDPIEPKDAITELSNDSEELIQELEKVIDKWAQDYVETKINVKIQTAEAKVKKVLREIYKDLQLPVTLSLIHGNYSFRIDMNEIETVIDGVIYDLINNC